MPVGGPALTFPPSSRSLGWAEEALCFFSVFLATASSNSPKVMWHSFAKLLLYASTSASLPRSGSSRRMELQPRLGRQETQANVAVELLGNGPGKGRVLGP